MIKKIKIFLNLYYNQYKILEVEKRKIVFIRKRE